MGAASTVRTGEAARRWPYSRQAVGRARRQVRTTLAAWGLADLAESTALVLSELMTNSLRHAPQAEGGVITTQLVLLDGGVCVEVHDSGTAQPQLRTARVDDEGGRGLALVDALTGGRWGVRRDAEGKTVWAFIGPQAPAFVPALLPVCGARRWLTEQLVCAAQALARADEKPPPVDRDLRCVLQAHTAGEHHAYVMHLDGRDTGSVWVRWEEPDGPLGLAVLPDCGAPAAAPLDEACFQYADHPGGHCYDLTDPWQLPVAGPGPGRGRQTNWLL